MIRVNTPSHPQTPAEHAAAGKEASGAHDPRRDPFRRRDQREPGLRGSLTQGGAHAPAEEESDRSQAFGQKMRDALDERGARRDDHHDDRSPRTEEGGTPRVLAVAETPPVVPFSPFTPRVPAGAPAVPEAVAGSGTAETVASLAARIEEAYRADLSAGDGRPVSVTVPLDGLIEGVAAIVVSVTPAGLDVTLSRFQGQAPDDFVQAAQMLAQHLQHRFAKRSVRILETIEGEVADGRPPRESGDALAAIGQLLKGSEG